MRLSLLHPSKLLLLALWALCACSKTAPDDRTLSFQRFGADARTLKLSELVDSAEVVTTFDPFYEKQKRFRALPMAALLERAYGESAQSLKTKAFVLRAQDGYKVPIAGSLLLASDAYLAIDDADVPGFAPIGPGKVSPAPAYLIWKLTGDQDLEKRPRPWQLVAFDMVDLETQYKHTRPDGEPADGPAMLGFQLFQKRCGNCHAINQEGGRVGPDLNVPQSIVEYRPEAQIRAYIQNPTTFRYGTMPAHPDLSTSDLDHLLAYFHAMAARKHDPAKDKP
ncbi:MAG: Cytochrome c family protein [Myxococcaceae bacterium]|nr:Cytochrome c family protein [Myxococcaceae bacterium]